MKICKKKNIVEVRAGSTIYTFGYDTQHDPYRKKLVQKVSIDEVCVSSWLFIYLKLKK